jgi:hypothetical protein
MKPLSSWVVAYLTPSFVLLILIAILFIGTPEAQAYEKYSGCKACHGSFRSKPYTSLSDGSNWGDNLHNIHRTDMLADDCDACHSSGGRTPVFMDSSKGGGGLAPIGCVGCHGREEDIGNDSESTGRGAGLRQHHTSAGVSDCLDCHSDADPANYTPVGEDVLPNFFANPGAGHPRIPTDSCNPAGKEDFAGTTLGLDNDGDGSYDTNDSKCSVITTYSIGGSVSGLGTSSLALQNNGADTFTITTNGSFVFATELEDGNAYAVTVSAQPTDQTCSVTNGSGTIAATNVTNVTVVCEDTAFHINPGLNDAWYNPVTSGQGFFITVFPDLGKVSLAWFTYDTELPPVDAVANLGDAGHRWITGLGSFVDNQVVMNVTITSGGIFDTTTEIQRTDPPGSDGTIILTFDSCNSGTVEYDITSIDRQGIIPIKRVADDNIVICEALKAD